MGKQEREPGKKTVRNKKHQKETTL